MRYLLQTSDTPGSYVCTDTENKIVCVFEDGKFNETQQFTTLEDFDPKKFMLMARFCREIGEWLLDNHKDKV